MMRNKRKRNKKLLRHVLPFILLRIIFCISIFILGFKGRDIPFALTIFLAFCLLVVLILATLIANFLRIILREQDLIFLKKKLNGIQSILQSRITKWDEILNTIRKLGSLSEVSTVVDEIELLKKKPEDIKSVLEKIATSFEQTISAIIPIERENFGIRVCYLERVKDKEDSLIMLNDNYYFNIGMYRDPESLNREFVKGDGTTASKCFESEKSIFVPDITDESRDMGQEPYKVLGETLQDSITKSIVCIPIVVQHTAKTREEIFGVLCIASSYPYFFGRDEDFRTQFEIGITPFVQQLILIELVDKVAKTFKDKFLPLKH